MEATVLEAILEAILEATVEAALGATIRTAIRATLVVTLAATARKSVFSGFVIKICLLLDADRFTCVAAPSPGKKPAIDTYFTRRVHYANSLKEISA
ncbi:MAG: hypothetical protein AAF671_14050 [Pseudomonadota bacterium]